ncbi:MAG TPA: methyltransferase domain-containing protein [Gemmatimonadaceae bacterium]|nr:methyltransferase domain-containing protein [Gemmatimonadaceae bacterium]
MTSLLSPRRRRGVEILDDPAVAPGLITRSMADVARANKLFGGSRAAIAELRLALASLAGRVTMVDVGTGRGDIPAHARVEADKLGIELWTIGVDAAEPLLVAHKGANNAVIRGNALALPLANRSVDIALCSQLLHHFQFDDAVAVVREMDRVARSRVIISDLRRSVIAAAGIWLASFPLRFHPVSRHDGIVSVMRGFTAHELGDIVEAAVGRRATVKHRAGFRLTASWTPASAVSSSSSASLTTGISND